MKKLKLEMGQYIYTDAYSHHGFLSSLQDCSLNANKNKNLNEKKQYQDTLFQNQISDCDRDCNCDWDEMTSFFSA